MCLIDAEIKETTEDIVCYKIYVSFEGRWVSPYMRSPIPNMNEVTKTLLGEPYEGNYVAEGFHSFATFEDAIEESRGLTSHNDCNLIIVRCIIPKDSKCYVGSFWGIPSYCSEKIILKEVCV